MNPYILLTVDGIDVVWNGERLTFLAGMQIDGDGSGGNIENDPDFQNDTSLHFEGQPLNAREDKWIVLPPEIILAVPGIVLGCQAHVLNTNGLESDCVVGDVGPRGKLGEGSIALANAIAVPSNPVTGGLDRRVIRYAVYPGMPALVDG